MELIQPLLHVTGQGHAYFLGLSHQLGKGAMFRAAMALEGACISITAQARLVLTAVVTGGAPFMPRAPNLLLPPCPLLVRVFLCPAKVLAAPIIVIYGHWFIIKFQPLAARCIRHVTKVIVIAAYA